MDFRSNSSAGDRPAGFGAEVSLDLLPWVQRGAAQGSLSTPSQIVNVAPAGRKGPDSSHESRLPGSDFGRVRVALSLEETSCGVLDQIANAERSARPRIALTGEVKAILDAGTKWVDFS